MQFCRGQSLADDARCCLFPGSNQIYKNKGINKPIKDGLVGLDINKNDYKLKNDSQKQGSVFKNIKQQTNQQKVSLSKMSGRRVLSTRSHCYQKQENLNICGSNASSNKVKTTQNIPIYPPTFVNMSYNQPKIQDLNLLTKRNIYLQKQVLVHQVNTYPNRGSNPIYQNFAVAATMPLTNQLTYKQNVRYPEPQKIQFQAKQISIKIPPSINKVNARPISQKYEKPQSVPQSKIVQQPILIRSINVINSQVLNGSNHDNAQGVKTLAPTIQTDRDKNIIFSEVKQGMPNVSNRLNKSFNKNSSQVLARQESEIANSRLTETLSPDLGRTNLKTVQSVYGSQAQTTKRQMHQSVILIDFFNPSQTLRKQIQNKIQNRHCPEFGN